MFSMLSPSSGEESDLITFILALNPRFTDFGCLELCLSGPPSFHMTSLQLMLKFLKKTMPDRSLHGQTKYCFREFSIFSSAQLHPKEGDCRPFACWTVREKLDPKVIKKNKETNTSHTSQCQHEHSLDGSQPKWSHWKPLSDKNTFVSFVQHDVCKLLLMDFWNNGSAIWAFYHAEYINLFMGSNEH